MQLLTIKYNKEINSEIEQIYFELENAHDESFSHWCDKLIDIIYDNIIEFNPNLNKQSKEVNNYTVEIESLEENLKQIKEYSAQIKEMTSWKTK